MKEAVVLILDANETMAASYNDETKSRFDCAKDVCLDMISDLMIRSVTHEVAVLVLKSKTTNHHFWLEQEAEQKNEEDDDASPSSSPEIPFPNIVELGGDGVMTGVNRPHPDLLRQVQDLQVTPSSKNLRGDFCDGIVVAADALFKRTSGKKYQRRIVLITDAEHKVEVDPQQLLVVLDSLRAMECRLEVIGMNFESQAEYEQAAQVRQDETIDKDDKQAPSSTIDSEMKQGDEDGDSATEASGDDDDEDEEDDDVDPQSIKRQNEKLLLSLTEKTGGFVMAAKELREIFQKVLGQRLPKSTRRKLQFQIAPGLVLDVRFSLLLSKASTPTLKKQAVELQAGEQPDDPDAQVAKDEQGKEVTYDFENIVTHWDPEQDTREIVDIASAYRYGTDLVPMSGYDMTGLKRPSPVKLTILGYLNETQVPRFLRIGPPYALAGADSLKSCAAIAALAVALQRNNLVGIATLVKTKDADPILVGLFPFNSSKNNVASSSPPRHLCMMQLPFRGDVANLSSSLDSLIFEMEETQARSEVKQSAADTLIDSLMLPSDTLDHTSIPNPYLRSFHQTVVQRILKPECGVVSVRSVTQDPMETPKSIIEQAQPAVEAFLSAFPLTKATSVKSAGRNGSKTKRKGPKSYHDFLQD
jgi:ATP-dependent DNA helicase 2 subunit 2